MQGLLLFSSHPPRLALFSVARILVPIAHLPDHRHHPFAVRAMSTKDVSRQSDINKMTTDGDGSFKRRPSSFRNFIEPGGKFEPEKDRYHLYISYACPWATRTLIMRKLKGLESFIDVSIVSPHMGEHGWPFASADAYPGATDDPIHKSAHVKDLYMHAAPDYDGRFTVPVLWDKKTDTIVNNESSEIIRMFNTAFNHLLPNEKAQLDFYPAHLRAEIDEVNEWVYDTVNNGVYKSGFASTQAAYEAAVRPLFESLDKLEGMLKGKEYLVGNQLTEADIRLFVTIVRFDPVYVVHFKCNIRTIRDGYPEIHRWMRQLYWKIPAFSETCDFDHIKTHYYWSHPFVSLTPILSDRSVIMLSTGSQINPHRIIPAGPIPNILPL
ncbi:uncharacterized protein FIBRA_02672 [Fibroporia radiculosa]|uniref:GST C-terminal domain-containing protein n=1 Tax=Fibroporia radiculosa TaxID=599839 RepID=J4GN14_9APHY|nr:uncharacterized protein FIBRA_02672 [Fibroporia radiculosa]CCM00635.1 predicted protein [Fibroporia radiculosa]